MGKKKQPRLPESRSVVANFEPRTDKQRELLKSIDNYEVTIATGPPGTGKTYVTLAKALQLLEQNFYKRIVFVKSITTIPGENLAALPGDVHEKMEPFLMSYTWNLDKIAGKGASDALMDKGLIEILPLAFIRGISIDDSIVIIDETQNIDTHTFKTLMTRIGDNSKYIFLGDIEQIDRKRKEESCLERVLDIFHDSRVMGIVKFDDSDCVRNPIISEILQKLRMNGI